MLKKNIIEFVMNSQYRTLAELQSNDRRREIKMELHVRESRADTQSRVRRPVHS